MGIKAVMSGPGGLRANVNGPGMAKSTKAKLSQITILADAWEGDESPYSQVVTVDGTTAYSKVDMQPSVEQLALWHQKDLAFVAENEDGVITVYAIGDKPANDYVVQVTVTEVSV